MPRVCILTDSSAQFTSTNFPGHELVYVIPFEKQESSRQEQDPLPRSASGSGLGVPAPLDFLRFYTELGRQYDSILTLLLSSTLGSSVQNALAASQQYSNHATIRVVDTHSVAVGLGLIVEQAARALSQGVSLDETVNSIRAALPRLYMLICVPELTYLSRGGHLDPAQALAGEVLGMLPVFAVEDGRLSPIQKVRTLRHLFESFEEFMAEFETPAHIALLRGTGQDAIRTRPLRQFVQETFPSTHYSEHAMSPAVEGLFGAKSIALVIQDSAQERPG
jgi:DegV family protein with EDD domain